MGWKENRRRKRRWYKKFEAIAKNLLVRAESGQANLTDIMLLFYQFAIAHRLFKYNWIKESALESLQLVCKDLQLANKDVVLLKLKEPGPDASANPVGPGMRIVGNVLEVPGPEMISIPVRINNDGKFEVGTPYPRGPYDGAFDQVKKQEPPF